MYSNKWNEELIELLEERDEHIDELDCKLEDVIGFEEEVSDLQNQIDDFNSSLGDREEVSEKAFYAGFTEGSRTLDPLKPWLNYKMEARI